ncbi:MAG TPA: TRAP transporter TatT component family protein [Pyrinomonadaceae bacterium]|nr:TRAP transporter TatT component family protein [Pyrinomonadaceae bacterium]
MNQPYNNDRIDAYCDKNGRKFGFFVLVMAVATIGISCRKAAIESGDRAAVRPAAEAIAEADQLYTGRADLVKVRQGIVALRQAQVEDQSNYELAWRLAKFNYYLGAHSPEPIERDKAFHDGVEAGTLAVKLQDGKPDGHFWLGANYGGKAQTSMLSGLSEIDDIKHEMETVLKLDEKYQSGSAYMVLGQVYLEAPGLLGGDTQKAIEYLEKGLRFGPDNALLRAHLAEAYVEAHRDGDARKQIDALLAMKPAPGYEPEHDEAVTEVKKLQEKIK